MLCVMGLCQLQCSSMWQTPNSDGQMCARWVALLAFGEGWHNNHHAFEFSARHGLEWWQLDPTWWVVSILGHLGLAKTIKLPTTRQKARLALSTAQQ